ncbi:MAG: GntR family transcriptional regulator [Cloacibacillus evryensis]
MIEAPVSRGTRIYEKVVEKLKGEIAAGNILPGDPLPSERQLMDLSGSAAVLCARRSA